MATSVLKNVFVITDNNSLNRPNQVFTMHFGVISLDNKYETKHIWKQLSII